MANQLRALFLGDADYAEFRDAVQLLAATSTLLRATDVEAALEQLDADDTPLDVIVVAQPFSGCVRSQDLEPLLVRAPLARVLVLSGSWCEGEPRSGMPLRGAIRILWHQWPARWQQELARWEDGGCPAWSLPVTATDDDRLFLAAEEPVASLAGRVAIVALEPTAGWLADLCRGMRLEPVVHSTRSTRSNDQPACDLVLFDIDSLRCDTQEEALHWARAWQGTPLLGLSSFLRHEDSEAWRRAGVRAILAQPVPVDDLRWHIAAQLRPAAQPRHLTRES